MTFRFTLRAGALCCMMLSVAACGNWGLGRSESNDISNASGRDDPFWEKSSNQSSVWDLFSNNSDPNVTIAVNKYLWNASLEVLNFLPVQSVDPFSGLIVTGYGSPPGGGQAYRATIHITDPALDARSLKVALESRGGTVSPETVRAVEDAILTRARQMRLADANL